MPLRFVVQAVLVEHLNSRHSLASMGAHSQHSLFSLRIFSLELSGSSASLIYPDR
ncbi:putative BTB/POZ domain-containing protein, partial [Sesbania bispinosa]